ncbi:type II secretion system major pseudopilin GspG [Verrucomicrobiota bacterium]
MNSKAGFTLLEILVVVLIITIIATIVGVKVFPQLGKAKTAAAIAQISIFEQALDLYRLDSGRYPTSEQGLKALCEKPVISPVPQRYSDEGYLKKGLPLDPWEHKYIYLVPGSDGSAYEIISYGSDCEPGGSGEAADISSIDLAK